MAVLTAAGIRPDKAKPNQVVEALRKIIDEQAGGKGLPVGAVVGFPRAISNPEGYLKADGSTFAQATYPDLHRVLGGNKLPNLTRSDIGMTAYFAFDDIPDGWIKYDEIAARVTQAAYPELYRLLVVQYGSIDRVPKAGDRFVRSAAGSLTAGSVQEASIAGHYHPTGLLMSDNDDWSIPRATEYGNKTSMQTNDPVVVVLGERRCAGTSGGVCQACRENRLRSDRHHHRPSRQLAHGAGQTWGTADAEA